MRKIITLFLLTLTLLIACKSKSEVPMEQLRELMVKRQIEARGIYDERVLDAMLLVERDKFIPDHNKSSAYEDYPLPIGHGQTISQPYIVALMSELCELDGTEKVLEIGTGSGYQAAILSLLAKEVYTIEIVEPLGKSAEKRLNKLGYDNVKVKVGDGYKGWPEKAPFDVIILTAAPAVIPQKLIDQLGEGGILIAPEGDYIQELIKLEKKNGKINRKNITHVRFVPMVHER